MIAHVLHACAILSLPSTSHLSTCRPVNLSICRPVDLSTCRLVTCYMTIFSTCQSVYLSTCRHVDLSTCRPVTCYMAIYGVCILLRGSGALPQAFLCESMPTPLTLTYILPYNCPCFARMRNSFPSVDLSSVDLSTCLSVNLSTCQPVDL